MSTSSSREPGNSPAPSSTTESVTSAGEASEPCGPTTTTMQSDSSRPYWIPKPYQSRAIKLLLSQASGGLLLDPGLGKTSTVLAAIKILKSKGLASKILIVAPLRVMLTVWPAEVSKWADFSHLRVAVLHGPKKLENLTGDADLYIINPEGLPWLAAQREAPNFDILVVDESTKFKASNTQRFRLLRSLLPRFRRRWILTGTPIPNGLEDLFGQIYILDQGRSLGRYITHYRNEFFDRAPWNVYQWTPKPEAFEQVTERISPLVIRLSAEENLQMPELQSMVVPVFLPDSVMRIYSEVEQDFISGDIIAANAAAAGVKCRQVANGAIYTNDAGAWREVHDAKLDALESLLGEIHPAPVLLLYEFQHDRDRICARFKHARTLDVGTDLERTVAEFNRGTVPLLIGHPASMGHGLNLQGTCHHVVWFGITWNLEHYDQAVARVYRQGQTSDRVMVYHIVAKNTLDEKVMKVLANKDKTQQGLLAALVQHRKEHYE